MTALTPLQATTNCPHPQQAYQRLREQWGHVAPVELQPGINGWLVMGYEEVLTVSRKEQVFSCDPRHWRDWQREAVPPDSGLGPLMFPRRSAHFADGDEHRRLRAPLDEGIARIDQRRLRRRVESMSADIIATFGGDGEADLLISYSALISMMAVGDLFGLDPARGYELRDAVIALVAADSVSQAAYEHFEEMLTSALHTHQAAGAGDLTGSFLTHPSLRGEEEVLQAMVLMIFASYGATTTWIAQTLALMLTDPRFAGRVRGGRMGLDEALDEVLWRDPPMANMPARYALSATELGGQRIHRGDALILGLAAANSDPRVHPAGQAIEPGNRAHLAWGAGPHACPAQVPARLITRTAVQTALNLLPDLRLALPAAEVPMHPSPWARCPATLPVTFSPAHPPRHSPGGTQAAP
jgi:cytochrome P450